MQSGALSRPLLVAFHRGGRRTPRWPAICAATNPIHAASANLAYPEAGSPALLRRLKGLTARTTALISRDLSQVPVSAARTSKALAGIEARLD
mmetsp:Transcript_2015/g.3583  ORF Transcript_2015/g.3583 Transcript_2015/m.3583 type:complete len:93 (+) Transcript_2015:135-413(+)